jgi:hypothetical protein
MDRLSTDQTGAKIEYAVRPKRRSNPLLQG